MASILHFYEELKPTAKKVLKIQYASPENKAQRNAFDHLVRYIKSLGGNVSVFLQFTTGADIIVEGQKLKVTFNELNGLQ
jgi:HJR/Mrr/RecB family endonuclease